MMIFARPGLIAAFAMLCVAPVGGAAVAASTDVPAAPAPVSNPSDPTTDEARATEPVAETGGKSAAETGGETAQDKRICRYVKLDTASRRKTKVCRNLEEWRELNNPR